MLWYVFMKSNIGSCYFEVVFTKKSVYFGGSFKSTMHVVTMAVVTKHSQNPFCGLKKLALLVKLARST